MTDTMNTTALKPRLEEKKGLKFQYCTHTYEKKQHIFLSIMKSF